METTLWFNTKEKPVRQGVYERQFGATGFQYWNGKRWGLFSLSPESAERNKHIASKCQRGSWRGLTLFGAYEANQPRSVSY